MSCRWIVFKQLRLFRSRSHWRSRRNPEHGARKGVDRQACGPIIGLSLSRSHFTIRVPGFHPGIHTHAGESDAFPGGENIATPANLSHQQTIPCKVTLVNPSDMTRGATVSCASPVALSSQQEPSGLTGGKLDAGISPRAMRAPHATLNSRIDLKFPNSLAFFCFTRFWTTFRLGLRLALRTVQRSGLARKEVSIQEATAARRTNSMRPINHEASAGLSRL